LHQAASSGTLTIPIAFSNDQVYDSNQTHGPTSHSAYHSKARSSAALGGSPPSSPWTPALPWPESEAEHDQVNPRPLHSNW